MMIIDALCLSLNGWMETIIVSNHQSGFGVSRYAQQGVYIWGVQAGKRMNPGGRYSVYPPTDSLFSFGTKKHYR